jgi:heme O synthase-like polyprenyltransferase
MRLRTREADRRVFRVSIPYLALLFAAMLVECLPA